MQPTLTHYSMYSFLPKVAVFCSKVDRGGFVDSTKSRVCLVCEQQVDNCSMSVLRGHGQGSLLEDVPGIDLGPLFQKMLCQFNMACKGCIVKGSCGLRVGFLQESPVVNQESCGLEVAKRRREEKSCESLKVKCKKVKLSVII